tara:strand:+ start:3515 stop:4732 length:1218 start_codon:yes stop_codon:yes gene_type:complete
VNKKNILIKNNIQSYNLNNKLLKKFSKNFQKIIIDINNDIKNTKKTLNVLDEKFKMNFKLKNLSKFKNFKTIAVIGMGGSILGSAAINSFLKTKIKKKLYFFDDINVEKIINFKKNKNADKTLFIIISKSGNTVETLSNLLSLNIIKKKSKNIIIISEKKNNILFTISKKFDLFFIEHKDHIGGRYSVLSAVGVLPAYLMGVNIFKLRKNLKKYLKNKEKFFLKDSTIKLSNLLTKNKYQSLIFLNYAPELEKFLYWCQQLIAESLGKKGKGFLPVISNAPKDHHSLLQLYLEGPRNKLFTIFSLDKNVKKKIDSKKVSSRLSFLHKKSQDEIKIAQKNALIKTLLKNKIPFREFKINSSTEETLGELFSYFILETVIIGKLLKINPFDQPAVEQVKIFTKKLLS